MSQRLIKPTTLTLTERILQSKHIDECSTTNEYLYRLIKLTNITLMTRIFNLNYFQDVKTTHQTHNSYP